MSRSMHHSQGTGAMRQVTPALRHSGRLRRAFVERSVRRHRHNMEPVAGRRRVGPILEGAIRNFEPAHPEKSIAR